jgi:hypothetical protein
MTIRHVLSQGPEDPRQRRFSLGRFSLGRFSLGRFSLGRSGAGRGLALLAVSGVLGLGGVIAGTAPAEAGPITVSLSANPTALLVGEATTLTAKATSNMGGPPFVVYIFDATTGTPICQVPLGQTCTTTETQSVATTHEFIAYVAEPEFILNTFPPSDIQATSPSVDVTWEPIHRIEPVLSGLAELARG